MELVGRIGKQGDFKYTDKGIGRLQVSIAVNQGFKEKKHTEWVKLVVFGKQAESLSNILKVGALVLVQSQDWKIEKWKGKDGEPGAIMSVVAQSVTILASPQREEEAK